MTASTAVVAQPAATEPAEAKPAQVATVVQETAEDAAESISALDPGYGPLNVSETEFTPLEKPADAIDVLEVVKRIPIPSTKTDLVTEVSGQDNDIDSDNHNSSNVDRLNEAPIAPSIVRIPAPIINVTTENDGADPN